MSPVRLHASNPNLCADVEFQNPPSHVADALEFASDYTKLQEEFCLLAQKGIAHIVWLCKTNKEISMHAFQGNSACGSSYLCFRANIIMC